MLRQQNGAPTVPHSSETSQERLSRNREHQFVKKIHKSVFCGFKGHPEAYGAAPIAYERIQAEFENVSL